MASNDDVLLLDTSAALALVDPTNKHHGAVLEATRGRRMGLSGHAEFEMLSVLTRLPYPARLSGADATRLLVRNFPETRHIDSQTSAELAAESADLGILGGAVYDGLVAACARTHGLPLITCDRRALPTYEALGIAYQIVPVVA